MYQKLFAFRCIGVIFVVTCMVHACLPRSCVSLARTTYCISDWHLILQPLSAANRWVNTRNRSITFVFLNFILDFMRVLYTAEWCCVRAMLNALQHFQTVNKLALSDLCNVFKIK